MQTFAQIIGWIGALLVMLAYFLVSFKKIDSASRIYQLMNLFGAIGVGINAQFQEAWPSFGLQIIWGLIAIGALIKSAKKT